MMADEELKEARDFEHCQEYEHCNADGIIENLLDHLEEQQTQLNHRYLDLQQVCDDQAKQIATLKAALIDCVAQDKIAQMGRFGFVLDSTVCDPYGDAKKQLAQKYPEIAWEEKKCDSKM